MREFTNDLQRVGLQITAALLFGLCCSIQPAEAQVKISELPAANPLSGTEEFPLVQGLSTAKTTTNNIGARVMAQMLSTPNAWSATNSFSAALTSTLTASGTTSNLTLSSALPRSEFINTSAPANNRRAIEYIDTAGTHHHGVCQDNTTCNDYIQITRTGSSVSALKFFTNNTNERLSIASDGSWTVGASAGASGEVLTSTGATTPPTWQVPSAGVVLANATFTPVCTAGGGMTTCTGTVGNYIRVGNQVSLTFSFNSTGPNATQSATIATPINSNITGSFAGGSCVGTGTSGSFGRVASGGANLLAINLNTSQTVSIPFSCSAMYVVN